MSRAFFSECDARAHVGDRVQALEDFPAVPAGTVGRVVRARRFESERWVVSVEWDLPRRRSLHFATVLNFSFNFQTQARPVTDQFTKDEFERLLGCSPVMSRPD